MSGGPRVRPANVGGESEPRPVLGNAGNKARSIASLRKPFSKFSGKAERTSAERAGEERAAPAVEASLLPPQPRRSQQAPVSQLRRQEVMLMRSNLSLNASCSSDCSVESFQSRASTGRIGGRGSISGRRKQGVPRPEKIAPRIEKCMSDYGPQSLPQALQDKRRCSWVTPNTDPCYTSFHDEEWGVPVHEDKKLFELLVLSGALAELTWPSILSKRQLFRETFMDFDPVAVSKLSEKKITATGSIASSLLSEPKLRAVIENANQILKIIEEFGSFDRYCWNFVNQKPIVSQFRYPRQVPVKTAKAEFISKDLVRRGFRSVGPTIIYSFMQVCGMTNDHLISCYRFEECGSPQLPPSDGCCRREDQEHLNYNEETLPPSASNPDDMTEEEKIEIDIVLPIEIDDLSIS